MAEKPIIFSTPMVQAILDSRKTQTRRVVKPQNTPCFGCGEVKGYWLDNETYWANEDVNKSDYTNTLFCSYCNDQIEYEHTRGGAKCKVIPAPYQLGDIRWVRETYSITPAGSGRGFYCYKADNDIELPYKWKSPYYMPRDAARIFLRVTDVRVERVQDISVEDAFAEGIVECEGYKAGDTCACAILEYSVLWDSINAKRGYGWDMNPWVWVITFERLKEKESR